MARTFLLTLHYDGGRFAGWQRQAEGRTVQGEIERVLERLCAEPVRVHAAGRTDAGVHAIGWGACARRYRYVIGTDEAARPPFRRRYEWPLGRPLDGRALGAAAACLAGEHDFHGFSVRSSRRAHTRCRVRSGAWTARPGGTGWAFDIVADRFLHHMVRMLVGTMADIGLARRPVSDMHRLLAGDPDVRTSPPAPPQGLFFVAAEYPPEWFACAG